MTVVGAPRERGGGIHAADSEWTFSQMVGQTGGRRLTIGFAATGAGVRYVQDHLLKICGAPRIHRVSPVLEGDPRAHLDVLDCDVDVLVVEGPRSVIGRLPRERSLIMPLRVHMVASLVGDGGDVSRLLSGEQRRQHRRRLSRFGYRYEISHLDADFLSFFDGMYLPTMSVRHGRRARTVGREHAKSALFDCGHLMLVYSGDRMVGGTVNHLDAERRQVNARLVGVLDGDERLMREGVVKTAGTFLLEWASTHAYTAVDFQGCEPFLGKGTFQAKIDLGAGAQLPPPPLRDRRLWLSVRRDSPAVRDFLVANPVIVLDDDHQIGAAYFHDGVRAARRDIRHGRRGLRFEALIEVTEFLKHPRRWTPHPLG